MKATITAREARSLNTACIADKMRLLNRVITNLYDDALRPLGITTSQMNILVVVARYGTASASQVGQWLEMERSTLSRNFDRLRKQGWLLAIPEGPGLAHRLRLTSKGTRILRKALPSWERAQDQARALLGDRGVGEIVELANEYRASHASMG